MTFWITVFVLRFLKHAFNAFFVPTSIKKNKDIKQTVDVTFKFYKL